MTCQKLMKGFNGLLTIRCVCLIYKKVLGNLSAFSCNLDATQCDLCKEATLTSSKICMANLFLSSQLSEMKFIER